MQNTGYNNTTLKQQNRGLILKLIVTGECESRIELAKRTGLSKMAVTNIISEFMEQNLVEEKNVSVFRERDGIRLSCVCPLRRLR